MEQDSIPFGVWLKRQRRARDLTQEELASRIGCALATLRKIESGERRPSKQILERLASILAIPLEERLSFVAYGRAVYPGEASPPPGAAPEAPAGAPWQTPSRDLPRHNLPVQLTSFIGREREIAEVGRLLAETRLLTLTGAGGCGKTRLALQVAGRLAPDFADGVWLVELASLYDPALVPQAVGAALGLRDQASRPMLDQLGDHLRSKRLLLVLDNCEHLIAACATVTDTLLRAAVGLKILVTSREPLAIAGETTYRVPSLETPDLEHLPPPASLAQFEAIRLFADRGAAALPGFAVSEARRLYEEGLAICREIDDRQGMAWALARLGLAWYWEGDPATGQPFMEQGLALSREINDRLGMAQWSYLLGQLRWAQGDPSSAVMLTEEGLRLCRELGDRRDLGFCLTALGQLALLGGDPEKGLRLLKEGLLLFRELGDPMGISGVLHFAAMASAEGSQPARALRLSGAGQALDEASGFAWMAAFLAIFQRVQEAARLSLTPEAAEAAWMEGRTMPLEQAIAEVLGETP